MPSPIRVLPLALGPARLGPPEVFCSFYALGCLAAYAKADRGGALREAFEFGQITPTMVPDAAALVGSLPLAEPAIVLLSCYVWNTPANLAVAREIRRRSPGSLVIAGGPHIPRNPDAAAKLLGTEPALDVLVRYEGEKTLAELLRVLAEGRVDAGGLHSASFTGVAGLTFRDHEGTVHRTPDRERVKDLETYPSPYLTGEFDHWIEGRHYMPTETNRGCPYGCTFCDWGAATLAKIHTMSLERVLGEIDFAAEKRLRVLGYCDANFGALPRDLEIVRHIVRVHEKTGFPAEVGYTNAKTANPRLGEIVKLLRDAGLVHAGQISMQTTDAGVLENVKRANIRTGDYEKTIAFYHANDIPAVSDMMIGLPGQTFATVKKDLQFFFDRRVRAVIFSTSVMPNAPMAEPEYRERFRIAVDADGFVESTYSFTKADYERMFELCITYKLFVKLGVLRYLLYFLQLEHGVRAMDFIERWMEVVPREPARYPRSAAVRAALLERDYRKELKDWLLLSWNDEQGRALLGDVPGFLAEIVDFFAREHGVSAEGSALEAILRAQAAVLPGPPGPARRVELPHDAAAWVQKLRGLPAL
ncbi:MAG: B12-binding domain-containing radical SAM protein, partial [Deltaproteobacteria bacterium]|nr:B12-binding domain-containing radical SAM protein [Deltaproteobacteria bacterium]